jgi:hypothetical protein
LNENRTIPRLAAAFLAVVMAIAVAAYAVAAGNAEEADASEPAITPGLSGLPAQALEQALSTAPCCADNVATPAQSASPVPTTTPKNDVLETTEDNINVPAVTIPAPVTPVIPIEPPTTEPLPSDPLPVDPFRRLSNLPRSSRRRAHRNRASRGRLTRRRPARRRRSPFRSHQCPRNRHRLRPRPRSRPSSNRCPPRHPLRLTPRHRRGCRWTRARPPSNPQLNLRRFRPSRYLSLSFRLFRARRLRQLPRHQPSRKPRRHRQPRRAVPPLSRLTQDNPRSPRRGGT